MSDTPADQDRTAQMLGEIAELSLALARDLATEARGAETPEQKALLADAFQKVSRGLRLTLALNAKLNRDAAREERDAAREAERLAAETQLRESRLMRAAEAAHLGMTNPTPEQNQKRRVK